MISIEMIARALMAGDIKETASYTLSHLRSAHSDLVESLATYKGLNLGEAPWIIYLDGTAIGMGAIIIEGEIKSWIRVPVYQSTRFYRPYIDKLMKDAAAGGLLESDVGKAMKIADIREAIELSIATIEASIVQIETARDAILKGPAS